MPNEFRTSVGGQALMEGIMMRGPEKICCAVRKPDGTIDLTYDKVVTRWYNKVPLLRGVCNMAENLYKGYKYLMHAADVAMEGVEDAEPESKLDKWLDEYMAATLRPTTLNGYRRSLELHVKPYLGNKTLSKITAVDLRSLYRTLQETGRVHPRDGQSPGLSARTVHGIHTTLHHALKTAMEQNLIPNNPAAEVDPPKFDGAPMKILTEAQLDAFMKVIEKDAFWHDFFYTAVTTGLRRGEICALRWKDFDTEQEMLHVRRTLHKEKGKPLTTGDTKTYAGTRKIVLPPSTAQLLRERKKTAPTEWIFPNPFDPEQPIAPGTAYNRLKALLKETGLPDIRFHDLRHTFATHALSSGVDAKTLAGILGHTKASFTLDTYTHTTGDMQKRAAEIVGGFLTDYLGEEMNPWQSRENMAAAPSV